MAISSHLFPGNWRNAGSPCTDAPCPTTAFFDLRFQNPVLPAHRVRGPRSHVLVVQQHHVEVIGIRQLAQLIDLLLRIHAFARRHLGHQPVRIARNALQRHAQHLVHLAVSLGGLEEANAPVVRMADQLGELVLPQFALRLVR